MAYDKAKRKHDRREADLLLNVVYAHMTLSSAKDFKSHKTAHDRFKDAVVKLHQFVTTEEEGAAPDAPAEQPKTGTRSRKTSNT
jgi:hypothetical protein